jgi:hypothetical protein
VSSLRIPPLPHHGQSAKRKPPDCDESGGFPHRALPDEPLDDLARLEERDTEQSEHPAENRFRRHWRAGAVCGSRATARIRQLTGRRPASTAAADTAALSRASRLNG